MNSVSEELDMVFELLSMVELGITYNDGTGLRVTDLSFRVTLSLPDVDGGAVDPFEAVKNEVLPQVESAWEDLKQSGKTMTVFTEQGIQQAPIPEDFKVRSAVMYRNILPDEDAYSYWLQLTV